jgi:hypothetical protein
MEQCRPGSRKAHDDDAHIDPLGFDFGMAGEPGLPLQPCREQPDDARTLTRATGRRQARLALDRLEELRERLAE